MQISDNSNVYLEWSVGGACYKYLAHDPDNFGFLSSDFKSQENVWIFEKFNVNNLFTTGDRTWIKSLKCNKYISHGVPGFMMRLVDKKGMDEIWPVGTRPEGVPVLSGMPILFPPIYRGSIWETNHFKETKSILRIFNGMKSEQNNLNDSMVIKNEFGMDIKIVFENHLTVKNEIDTICNNGNVCFKRIDNRYDTFIKHYLTDDLVNPFLCGLNVSWNEVYKIVINKNGMFEQIEID